MPETRSGVQPRASCRRSAAAVLARSSLLAADWIDSGEGEKLYPPLAIAAALIAIVTAVAVVGRRRPAA